MRSLSSHHPLPHTCIVSQSQTGRKASLPGQHPPRTHSDKHMAARQNGQQGSQAAEITKRKKKKERVEQQLVSKNSLAGGSAALHVNALPCLSITRYMRAGARWTWTGDCHGVPMRACKLAQAPLRTTFVPATHMTRAPGGSSSRAFRCT